MKQTIFTLLLFCVTGLMSCRKDTVQPDIKQYDQTQIQNYISANGITGMVRDMVGGDTTGIYYKIIKPGTGTQMAYTDQIAFVFTLSSFDGKYISSDTISNHFYDYLGHVATDNLPLGLQTALINDLKNKGGSMRVLIPSHLAYGVKGNGSGSNTVANNKIAGNQCLDYYVHVIGDTPTDNQATYDDQVIQNYMKANSLTGYTKTADGLYYKTLTPATGSDPITMNSTVTYYDTGQLFNGTIIDNNNATTNTTNLVDFAVSGIPEGLIGRASVGTKISLLIPSGLGYGTVAQGPIPPNSCLRFTFVITAVTP
jgi:FKBP-type peptidyl-prolyl cis-trans isomerase FkpA